MRHIGTTLALCLILACSPPQESSNTFDTSQYHGRWLVVNYWAEWCVPCREEIPELNRLARGFAESTSVLGVNYDGLQAEALESAVAAMGIEFPSTGDDPSLSLKVPRPNVLPTTLVFNPEGKLAHTLLGPQTFDGLSALLGSASPGE